MKKPLGFQPSGEQLEDILQGSARGEHLTVIGARHGVKPDAIRRVLIQNGAPTNSQRAQQRRERMVEMYHEGISVADIGKHFGFSRENARQQLKRMGVSLRDENTAHRAYIFEELEFLCGTDTFESLCERLGTNIKAVKKLCENWNRQELYARLTKTRLANYTKEEDFA